MKQTETIAAIATALSDSGIGIVRISGDDAIEIGSRFIDQRMAAIVLRIMAAIPFITGLLWMGMKSWMK